ncbi:MAG: Mrp/NBP35 family ATP-binding protein [candidate division NC10 bacterium]|nr:Mrp/NBP35 family ATP-binding protein [candidate division NC10 bacterium]
MLERSRLKQLDQEYIKRSEVVRQVEDQIARVRARMDRVRHKVAVMSGKGGVGKSLVTVNLAVALMERGEEVGILDADLNGPSIPTMLGVERRPYESTPEGALPAVGFGGIKVASIELLLPTATTPTLWKAPQGAWDAVWKGTMEMSTIREFLGDVAWGALDFLLIDLPPGTGDKPATIAQWIPDLDGTVVVTMPSKVSKLVVARSIQFAQMLGLPVIGLVENMAGFCCLTCGAETELFGRPCTEEELGVPILGRIPFDCRLTLSADEGRPFVAEYPDAPAAGQFREVAAKIKEALELKKTFFDAL